MINVAQSSSSRALDLSSTSGIFPRLKHQRRRGSLSLPPLLSRKKHSVALALTTEKSTRSSPSLASGLGPSLFFHPGNSKCHKKKVEGNEEEKRQVTSEKLDAWLRDSIGEIVRNIREAPFLVQIFSSSESARSLRLDKEAALPESWPLMKKKWEREGRRPDGIVLVEELKGEERAEDEDGRRTWGLVVQGRGLESASCYILNTCRVRSTAGFCTHFCLVRAKCFGGPLEMQLKKAWLH